MTREEFKARVVALGLPVSWVDGYDAYVDQVCGYMAPEDFIAKAKRYRATNGLDVMGFSFEDSCP